MIRVIYPTFPVYWERIIESYSSSSEVIDRLTALEIQFTHSLGKVVAVDVEKSEHDVMTVGLAGTHLLLIHTTDEDVQHYSVGNRSARGQTMVVMPEGIEIPNSHFLPFSRGCQILVDWLEHGIDHDPSEWTDCLGSAETGISASGR